MLIEYCAMGRRARHDAVVGCEKMRSRRSLSGIQSVSGRGVVRVEGCCGDAVDLGRSGVLVVVTATRRLFAWSELELWRQ